MEGKSSHNIRARSQDIPGAVNTNTHAQKSLYKDRPVIEARCTLDRLIKAPISSIMALVFSFTEQHCSCCHVRVPTVDSKSGQLHIRLEYWNTVPEGMMKGKKVKVS